MMKDFYEYGAELREFLANTPKPDQTAKYFAMLNGEVREFPNKTEALKFSKIVEKVSDEEPRRAWDKKKNELAMKQLSAWETALRLEFKYLTNKQFARLFNFAERREENQSHDDIAYMMGEIAEIFKD